MKSRFACWLLALFACTASAQTPSFSELVVFGDSLSDTGTIATLIGTRPDQVITNNSYVPTYPYRLGRFSNGLVWVDSFASALGLSSENSLGHGGNYAFGGARTTGGFPPPSLRLQADAFIGANHDVVPSDALYVIAGGGTNARDALGDIGGGADVNATIAATARGFAADILGIVDDLQAAGARNIIVWNTPDVGVAPATLAAGPGASVLGTSIAAAMNAALATRLIGEDVQVFDLFGLVDKVVQHRDLYGLIDVANACGAILGCDPSQFLFWDGIHPTSEGHLIISQAMLGLVVGVPEPSSVAMLLAGLVLMVWIVRRQARM
jgi:outer membrane lipase/esterase